MTVSLCICGGVCVNMYVSLCAIVSPQTSYSRCHCFCLLYSFFLFIWFLCDMSLVRLTTQQLLFPLTPSPIVPIYTLLSDRGHVQCHLILCALCAHHGCQSASNLATCISISDLTVKIQDIIEKLLIIIKRYIWNVFLFGWRGSLNGFSMKALFRLWYIEHFIHF